MLYNKNWDRSGTNPVSEALLQAADLIEKHGLAKLSLVESYGSMCFVGALSMATTGSPMPALAPAYGGLIMTASKAVAEVLNIPRGEHSVSLDLVNWNNAAERTAQEVIAAMRLAAQSIHD